jgi:ferrochelatase
MIFFSAHGVPLAYVEEAGDPYKAEMEECVELIMEELEKRGMTNPCTLAYQVNTLHTGLCIHRPNGEPM